MRLSHGELKALLDLKSNEYNRPGFIATDPISIPHRYKRKQDIEISAFFAATLAWGQRRTIISNCNRLMDLMDDAPHQFIVGHKEKDLARFDGFCHRTFNNTDLLYFVRFLSQFYKKQESLERAFVSREGQSAESALTHFHDLFFSLDDFPQRTRKHVSTPARKSACKRLNMFLRWMVRSDNQGVDFGIWKHIAMSDLVCPCDVHVERVARKLKLISRKNVGWLTAVELTENLRKFDEKDPVRYDFALFGLGLEGF
jgi:uncharacterized protein (TIGR02757 family)